ncbi:hypothetical protein H5410_022572 [Solanum commersonii]|uniref:Uncharacterized protein n=1 Tax=Solanum commersonii TaxID=4109 RepID=A0A9J5ZEE0_SOLCO|nr:hypothetical protein H5410_022572 [Solanum commersonii]
MIFEHVDRSGNVHSNNCAPTGLPKTEEDNKDITRGKLSTVGAKKTQSTPKRDANLPYAKHSKFTTKPDSKPMNNNEQEEYPNANQNHPLNNTLNTCHPAPSPNERSSHSSSEPNLPCPSSGGRHEACNRDIQHKHMDDVCLPKSPEPTTLPVPYESGLSYPDLEDTNSSNYESIPSKNAFPTTNDPKFGHDSIVQSSAPISDPSNVASASQVPTPTSITPLAQMQYQNLEEIEEAIGLMRETRMEISVLKEIKIIVFKERF